MGTTTGLKWFVGVGVAAALTVGLADRRAQAAPTAVTAEAKPIPAAPNKLALVLGLGSPWGELGVSYQRYVSPSLAIETGVGVGATGVQLMVLPKLLFGSGNAHLYVQAGPSVTLSDQAGAGVWATSEVGFESSLGGWTFGFGGGAGLLIAGQVPTPICFDACSTLTPGRWLPEIRLTIGRNF